jgi:hypothetical protein
VINAESSRSLTAALAALLSRRRAVRGLAAASAAPFAAGGLGRARSIAAAQGTPVGLTAPGLAAFEFVGKIDQTGTNFNAYGYLSHVAGLDEAALFTDDEVAARGEATARLLFAGGASLVARSVLDNLFDVTSVGSLRFALADGGASFAAPESFAGGTAIAEAALRIRTLVNVQAPQQGIASGFGELVLEAVTPFGLDGEEYAFGAEGLTLAVALTGQGTLHDPDEPRSTIVMAGYATPTGAEPGA